MKRTIQYIPPTNIVELKDFQKLNYHIEGEIWKPVPVDGWEDFKISNYGRLFNTKTNKFRQCYCPFHRKSGLYINTIIYNNTTKINGKYISQSKTICDLMLYTFYPEIKDEYINPIPVDGNIFNLYLDNNIRFVSNAYYEGDNKYKKEWIYIDGEKTKYTIDIYGVIVNQETGRVLRRDSNKATDQVLLSHMGLKYPPPTRMRMMGTAFIPNPNNLRYVTLIDETNTKPSLDNICWTNRKNLIKQ